MKEKIKKILLVFILVIVIVLPLFADARSGCCSHHGGVCGCGCCDGSPLSSTCAPYYPKCNSGYRIYKVEEPVSNTKNILPSPQTYNVKDLPTSNQTYTATPMAQTSNKEDNSGLFLGLGTIAIIGIFVGRYWGKRNKQKNSNS